MRGGVGSFKTMAIVGGTFTGVIGIIWFFAVVVSGGKPRHFIYFGISATYFVLVMCLIDVRTSQMDSYSYWEDLQVEPFSEVLTGSDQFYKIEDGANHIHPELWADCTSGDSIYRIYPMYSNPTTQSVCDVGLFWTTQLLRQRDVATRTPPLTFYANFEWGKAGRTQFDCRLVAIDLILETARSSNSSEAQCSSRRLGVVPITHDIDTSVIPMPFIYDDKVTRLGIAIGVFWATCLVVTVYDTVKCNDFYL